MIKRTFEFLCLSMIIFGIVIVPVEAKQDRLTPEELANRVILRDLEIYGTQIDDYIIVYDSNLGIDLLGINEWKNDFNVYARAINYGQIYSDCFTNVTWILRDGIWSLSITHTFNGISFAGGHNGQIAFDALAYFRAGIQQWTSSSTSSMKNQFQCHVDVARQFKNPYNLEPSTPDKGYLGFVASACN